MSEQYNNYLENHKENVAKGFEYIRDNIPSMIMKPIFVKYTMRLKQTRMSMTLMTHIFTVGTNRTPLYRTSTELG